MANAADALTVEDLQRRHTREIAREHRPGYDVPELGDAPLSLFVDHDNPNQKVRAPLCEWMCEQYDAGERTMTEMAEDAGLGLSTVKNHIDGGCKHERVVDGPRCDVVRDAAHDGVSYNRIAEMFDFLGGVKLASWHARGECTCMATVPPVEKRPLPENIRNGGDS